MQFLLLCSSQCLQEVLLNGGAAAVQVIDGAAPRGSQGQHTASPVSRINLAGEQFSVDKHVDDRADVALVDTDQTAELLLSQWADLGQGHEYTVVMRGQVTIGEHPCPIAPRQRADPRQQVTSAALKR